MSAQRKYVQHLAPFLVSLIPFCVCLCSDAGRATLFKKQQTTTKTPNQQRPQGHEHRVAWHWIESNKERCRNLHSLSHWEVGTCSMVVSCQKTPVITSLEEHTNLSSFLLCRWQWALKKPNKTGMKVFFHCGFGLDHQLSKPNYNVLAKLLWWTALQHIVIVLVALFKIITYLHWQIKDSIELSLHVFHMKSIQPFFSTL